MNDFLRGISRGIFGEMERGRVRQEKTDMERKGQIIDLLSNLAPQVEPDSLPLLMGHLGDTIGIKGKARKFWDVFSGQPDMTPEAQMGDLVRNLSSQLTGPDTAQKIRAGGDMARLFQPTDSEQEANRRGRLDAEAGLSNRIVFRDPREEKLEELQTRFQGQLANQQAQTAFKESLMLNRMTQLETQEQKNRKELVDYKADSKAQEEINERAWRIAINKGFREPNGPIKAQAASELAREQGWSNEKLQAQIQFLNARAQEAQANAQAVGEFGMKTKESETLNLQKKKFYEDVSNEYTNSLGLQRSAEAKLKELRDGLRKQAELVKSKIGIADYTEADARQAMAYAEDKIKTQLTDEEGKLAAAKSRNESAFNRLQDPANVYYRVGKLGDPIAPLLAPKKAVPPSKPQRPTARAGMGTSRGLTRFKPKEGVEYEPNKTEVFIKGRKHIVVGFDPDGTIIAKPLE